MEKIRLRDNRNQLDGPVKRNAIGEVINTEASDNSKPQNQKGHQPQNPVPSSAEAELLRRVKEAKQRRPRFD
jgi:hypothetical protein